MSGYGKFKIAVFSTLNQPVSIRIAKSALSSGVSVGYFLDSAGADNYKITVPASLSVNYSQHMLITEDDLPPLKDGGYKDAFRIHYKASTAPTSGSISIILLKSN